MVRALTMLALLASASTVLAADSIPVCSASKKCPADAPCCSQYGQCGTGAYCLGGCDPTASNTLEACVPQPVCKSGTFNFDSMDRITPKAKYLGDSSKTDWVMDGQAVAYDGDVLLTMAPDTVGTLLASSTHMWYGNVKATFKTSRGAGVVTAFILLGDSKDEIDYEFVGVDLKTAQTNYYRLGITNYANSGNITLSDTFNNFHTYEIDWTPEQITWKIDGQVGRVKKRSETWNSTDNQYHYPQTPMRVQLSLWPGGLESNAKGTVDWAGGHIDWNGADIQSNGYYYAIFKSVEINCYDGKNGVGTNNGVSYTYKNSSLTEGTVIDGNKPTILKSLQGTGTDMNKGDPGSQSSQSGSANPTKTAESIPGLVGGGSGANNHADSGSNSGSSGGSGGSTESAGGAETTESSGGSSNGEFSQGNGASNANSNSNNSKNSADKLGSQERILKGSVFAGVIAVVAMMAM